MDYCLEYERLKDENHIFKSISYDELINLLDTFHSGLIFIGGPWCKNCQAIIDIVNQVGKKRGLDCIYNYDPRFVNIYGEVEDLRDCKSLEVKLKYYAIVEKIGYKTEELVQDTLIPRIHVPFFVALKNGTCVGYYFAEYLRDGNVIHKENEDVDMTVDFVDNIVELIHKIENDKRYL